MSRRKFRRKILSNVRQAQKSIKKIALSLITDRRLKKIVYLKYPKINPRIRRAKKSNIIGKITKTKEQITRKIKQR